MERFVVSEEAKPRFIKSRAKPVTLKEITLTEFERIKTGLKEFNRVLGSGVVVGSLNLIGGDPGVGKSTLMLMLAREFCNQGKASSLYQHLV